MALTLVWERDQHKEALQEMRARDRVMRAWRMVWSVCVAIGALSLIAVFVLAYLQGLPFWEFLLSTHVLNLGVLIGILGSMFRARDFAEGWQEPLPLAIVLEEHMQEKQEVSAYMSSDALRVIDDSFLRGPDWYPWYLFMELLKHKRIEELLTRLGMDPSDFKERAKHVEFTPQTDHTPAVEKNQFTSIVFKALEHAYHNGDDRVHLGDLFAALISAPSVTRDFMVDQGLREDRLKGVNSWLHFQAVLTGRRRDARESQLIRTHAWRNQLWTSTATPLLDSVGHDMTRNSWQYAQMVSRDQELALLYEQIGAGNFGALVVGPRGSGKIAFMEGLAKKVMANQVPPPIADRRMVTLSLAKLLALSNARTPFKTVAAQLAQEIARSGNIIIVLEDLATFEATKTDEAGMLVESLLVDTLRSGNVLLFATVNEEELSHLSGPLVSSLPRVDLPSLDNDAAIRVIESSVPQLESQYNVAFTYPALERIVELSSRFIHDEAQPGKARTLMSQVAQEVSARGERVWIHATEVEQVVAAQTGIPATQVTDQEQDLLVNLEERISEKYINQVTAVKAVATAMRRARTQLGSNERPIANMLFLGPTGVGKTELAKRLAEIYFGGRDKMVRLDMSEYQETQSLRNLIGAPVGTAGGDSTGHLVAAIRANPFVVILLDEFEKAHPDVLNIFLQVMEDGRLTAPSGDVYDFTNSLIIATSNAGAATIQAGVQAGKNVQDIAEELKQHELTQHFKPELINRFDAVVVFEALALHHIIEIAKLLLNELAAKLAQKEIVFVATDEALQDLATAGYVPEQGARPLRRVIQDRIEDQIAKLLLTKEVQARDTITVNKGFELTVQKAQHYN